MVIISIRHILLILAFLGCIYCSSNLDAVKVRNLVRNVEAKVNEFAIHAAGSSFIKQKLANFSLTAVPTNGENLIKKIQERMKAHFKLKTTSLQRIISNAEEGYKNHQYDQDIKPFKYFDSKNKEIVASYNLSYDPVFNTKTSRRYSSIQVPDLVNDKAPEIQNTIKWTAEMNNAFIVNWREDRDIKWQFFGLRDGVFRWFPGNSFNVPPDGIDRYDARKRPWYIRGSASPKNVVIVIDGSGSMYGRGLNIAIQAASELIETLSENDFFNLFWFNIDVHYLACEGKLVQATSQNKKYYKKKMKHIRAAYVASLPIAYKAAFELLDKNKGADCQKMISVFTDGPSDTAESVFKKYNTKNEVRLFTYAVGPPTHVVEALKSIACSNKGFFYRIPDVESVRDVIKEYVTVLSRPMGEQNKKVPIWSSVYLDANNLGMLISGTLPAFDRSNRTLLTDILGVAGIDVSQNELKKQSTSASLDNYGYFFLIDNNGHVILHPRFFTETGYLPDSPNIYLSEVEYSWNVNGTEPEKLHANILKTEDEIGNMSFDAAIFSQTQEGHRVKKGE
ncbi:voltage-dependent calcium channel subunit alpha-2/delta-3-like [Xenia sp. Carnegie-2017]|uniref:voltage-dependent calcium channel subunit alpha-2/delta-3-like n=1 Tax=Xenia sp. Carnegie-2017 TaxID=2897299 RepID=UPI001F03C3CC|nr:voltage-dependent calcium channel subunit alpha-2/delta-3-like [Xenia sp. Carnegie-2017]